MSSPTNSIYNGWQKEKQELEDKIQAQAAQIEKIQAELQSKISRSKDLEDKLADALELAQTRDERHVEMLEKFEQLMSLHAEGTITQMQTGDNDNTEISESPTTPDRITASGNPPPTKKANTNSSPHRNIYSMFRQQPPRRQTSRNSSVSSGIPTRKYNTPLLTQPMDTDEDPRQLLPGAKPGNKME